MDKKISYKHVGDLTGHRSGIYALLQGDERGELLSAGGDGSLIAWNTDNYHTKKVLTFVKDVIFCMAKTPDKTGLILGTMSGKLIKYNRKNNRIDPGLKAHDAGVFDLLFIDDNRLATIGGDGRLKIWDAHTFTLVHEVALSDTKLRSLDLNAEKGHLAVGTIQGVITVLDVKNLKTIIRFKGHDRGIYFVKYHPHKKMLITGCIDGVLNFWQIEKDYKHVYKRAIHQSSIYGFDHHKWDDLYVTVSKDKSVKIWDPTFDVPKTIDRFSGPGHRFSVNTVCWLHNGLLATAGDDKLIKLWEVTLS